MRHVDACVDCGCSEFQEVDANVGMCLGCGTKITTASLTAEVAVIT